MYGLGYISNEQQAKLYGRIWLVLAGEMRELTFVDIEKIPWSNVRLQKGEARYGSLQSYDFVRLWLFRLDLLMRLSDRALCLRTELFFLFL